MPGGTPFDTAGSVRSGRIVLWGLRGGFLEAFCHRPIGQVQAVFLSSSTRTGSVFVQHALDRGRRNWMAFCDLPQALSLAAVTVDRFMVQDYGVRPMCVPCQTHPLDDQASFQLGDRGDDHDDGPDQRSSSVDVFPQRTIRHPAGSAHPALRGSVSPNGRSCRLPRPKRRRSVRGGHRSSSDRGRPAGLHAGDFVQYSCTISRPR